MTLFCRLLCGVLLLAGIGLLAGGAWLVALGGSPYYALVGIAYVAAAILLYSGRATGLMIVVAVAIITLPWAIWEAGLDFWALFPRLLSPLVIACLAFLVSLRLCPTISRRSGLAGAVATALPLVAILSLAFAEHGAIRPTDATTAYRQVAGDNRPSDWTSYGKTTSGLRYSTFDQINRDTVGQLEPVWTYRTGKTVGVDQNTPLLIGDTLYSCTPSNVVAALDVDSGAPRWTFDPKAEAPMWQRCRGLGYFKMSAPAPEPAAPCHERLIMTTIDARLMALDTKTGTPCPDFGSNGTVSLAVGMGELKAGYYFQTSAPLVARDRIIIGGWVKDNQETGEPSGVIRAFNAITGELEWAWDLADPSITRLPPEGKSYSRGTPNMWTTAAFDEKLGLIYAPLGNATPDYYGAERPAHADAYNATLVALDVTTGRERWRFRTVNHDIWDYDLPSQPALIDLPDGKGSTIAAVLQTTKRGQIFLLDRASGEPISRVEERPVPQSGAAPEEKLASTQPYSIDMPVIGADRLSEEKAWGLTMFDQLACRIAFRKLRYDGDFTPIGLQPALQQPGNLGGMNWGSVSVDVPNNRVFLNDIRVPSVFRLISRAEYADQFSDAAGHGPAPQFGTPYGMETEMWESPIGVPCNQPPFGTITAIDLTTKTIAWQVPAGTAEELGPLRLKLSMPMPLGLPTYAGSMTTAGGLVFFAGFQDHYIRAYDAEDGTMLWQYPLPVSASATPMTYVSPKTGRQYVVVSVGGAPFSEESGDYLIAFALPGKASGS
ncbi:membrane-bound PQQ-dependent dehydrogenase, glucose/quinate/shikimate family [Rhizobium sp. G187]|uniref:membrane-bound PQQ-dependent dehydrogenase, glucose/quinate/shikimate family n=1 Tax=Rhizobium sp. G187 TaxID=3451352 RepID=UPI003EE4A32C